MRIKCPNKPPPTASAVGPCPTVFKIVGRPGTGSLPSTFAPPDHPCQGSNPRRLRQLRYAIKSHVLNQLRHYAPPKRSFMKQC